MGESREIWQLRSMQAAPLSVKIAMAEQRIREWIDHYGEDGVYVSFSGGKDSTVLLDLVRKVSPKIPAVFVNTGMEYPEIRKFALSHENVIELQPRWGRNAIKYGKKSGDVITFRDTLEFYGYPIISKAVSNAIVEARRTPGGSRAAKLHGDYKRKDGGRSQYDCSKYLPLYELPVRISNECCGVSKKAPLKAFERKAGTKPIVGVMACESLMRETAWMAHGCNAFDSKRPLSAPMSFWLNQDVLQYIYEQKLEICSVYGDIVAKDDDGLEYCSFIGEQKLYCTGCQRTGCIYCAFGAHLEKGETRFQRLKRTHPKQYDYCMRGGNWKANEKYDPTCTDKKIWNPKEIWVPSKDGLGMAKVFDMVNEIYGKDFLKYE